jgi:hypothetical protein
MRGAEVLEDVGRVVFCAPLVHTSLGGHGVTRPTLGIR